MFDERRQRTVGIDKSYPLQPISGRQTSDSITTNSQTVKRLKAEQRRPAKSADPDLMVRSLHNDFPFPYTEKTQFIIIFHLYTQNGNIMNNRLNGNYGSGTISNKLSDNDYLDNEQFPGIITSGQRVVEIVFANLLITRTSFIFRIIFGRHRRNRFSNGQLKDHTWPQTDHHSQQ